MDVCVCVCVVDTQCNTTLSIPRLIRVYLPLTLHTHTGTKILYLSNHVAFVVTSNNGVVRKEKATKTSLNALLNNHYASPEVESLEYKLNFIE